MCVKGNSSGNFVYVPLPPGINLKHLNSKSEADRRKTYETSRVPFMDANQLAAAGLLLFCRYSSAGYHFVGSLKLCGLKSHLFFLTASVRKHTNSLPEAVTCAASFRVKT